MVFQTFRSYNSIHSPEVWITLLPEKRFRRNALDVPAVSVLDPTGATPARTPEPPLAGRPPGPRLGRPRLPLVVEEGGLRVAVEHVLPVVVEPAVVAVV